MEKQAPTMPYVKVKERFQVTIPAQVRQALHIEEGDLLEAQVEDGRIVLKPKAVVDRDSVEAAIEEGLADARAGRVHGPFESMEEFKASLKDS